MNQPSPYSPPPRSARSSVRALAALGCVTVLALTCVCALGVGYAACENSDPGPDDAPSAPPARLLDGVLAHLRGGDFASAHARMSSAFRDEWSPERVRDVVASSRALSTQRALHVTRVHYEQRGQYGPGERCFWDALSLVATVDGTLDTADGAVTLRAQLIREAGTWRYKQIDVPGASLGGLHRPAGGAAP